MIAGARRLRAAGMSLREVAKTLRAASYVSRSGREFAASAIAAMCREPDTAAV